MFFLNIIILKINLIKINNSQKIIKIINFQEERMQYQSIYILDKRQMYKIKMLIKIVKIKLILIEKENKVITLIKYKQQINILQEILLEIVI